MGAPRGGVPHLKQCLRQPTQVEPGVGAEHGTPLHATAHLHEVVQGHHVVGGLHDELRVSLWLSGRLATTICDEWL